MKEKLALQLKEFSNEEMTIINFSQGGSEKSGPTSKSSTELGQFGKLGGPVLYLL